ncbi:MAG: hypothetical protein HYT90_01660 [Candidatus Omnitrophica bacterium]|nr:hypothetical protein [Candidatus Omnitrophota bacterium]
MPAELGHVSQVVETPIRPPAKLVVLIQDAHVNYEAQRHLAGIVDRLAEDHGIRLILVEGGEGDVSLSSLRRLAPAAIRKEEAEAYLRQGLISGEEYLDLVSDHPLLLWGVDDLALYDQHYQMYMELEQARGSISGEVGELAAAIERLQGVVLNQSLRTLEQRRAAFQTEALGLGAYVAFLVEEAGRLGVPIPESTPLGKFQMLQALEQGMERERVAQDQRAAVALLREQLERTELDALTALGQAYQAGRVAPQTFYHRLAAAMDLAGLARADFPHLERYIRYLALKAQVQAGQVWSELQALHAQLRERRIRSAEERDLLSLADAAALLTDLLAARWTPEDHQAYRRNPDALRVERWLAVLQAQTAQQGPPWAWSGDAARIDAAAALAVRFYEAAAARDEAMARRALAKMDAEGAAAAVLIVGGFHAGQLSRLLAEQGADVAVVTPLVGREETDARYAEVLKAKYRSRLTTTGSD